MTSLLIIAIVAAVVACTALTVWAACALDGQVAELEESMARFDEHLATTHDDGSGLDP